MVVGQAARHIASIMAQRKVENNVTWFNPNGQRKHFGPEFNRFYQVKLAQQFEKVPADSKPENQELDQFQKKQAK